MTDQLNVSQRAREAAVKIASLTRRDGRQMFAIVDGKADDHPFVQAFARFERELSTNKDETIAKSLFDVIVEAKRNLRLTQGCLDCNADDERRWTETIAWLEGLA